jgi:hypothetical protein
MVGLAPPAGISAVGAQMVEGRPAMADRMGYGFMMDKYYSCHTALMGRHDLVSYAGSELAGNHTTKEQS